MDRLDVWRAGDERQESERGVSGLGLHVWLAGDGWHLESRVA